MGELACSTVERASRARTATIAENEFAQAVIGHGIRRALGAGMMRRLPFVPRGRKLGLVTALLLLSGCDRPDPKRVAEARAAEASAASQRAYYLDKAAADDKARAERQQALSQKLARIAERLTHATDIPSCSDQHANGDGAKRAVVIDGEHLDVAAVASNVPGAFAQKTVLGALTSERLYVALSSDHPVDATRALDFVDATAYLVVVRPTKHRSPHQTAPEKFDPGVLAATGYLFDLAKGAPVCQTNAETTEIGAYGVTGVREGDASLPVDAQLDRQLGGALMRAFNPRFHLAVRDFGSIHRDESNL